MRGLLSLFARLKAARQHAADLRARGICVACEEAKTTVGDKCAACRAEWMAAP